MRVREKVEWKNTYSWSFSANIWWIWIKGVQELFVLFMQIFHSSENINKGNWSGTSCSVFSKCSSFLIIFLSLFSRPLFLRLLLKSFCKFQYQQEVPTCWQVTIHIFKSYPFSASIGNLTLPIRILQVLAKEYRGGGRE